MQRCFVWFVAMALSANLSCMASAPTKVEAPVAPTEAVKPLEVSLFAMSMCPYGVKAEQTLAPALAKFGSAVKFRLFFIGDEPQPGTLKSMHGDDEVMANRLQACTQQHAPDRLMDVVLCMNEHGRQMVGEFDACATRLQMDGSPIRACAGGEEGTRLLSESFKTARDQGISGSPTILIQGDRYAGGRQTLDFMRAICNRFESKPAACAEVPESVKIPLTVLTDARCTDCDVDRFMQQLKALLPGVQPRTLDYATEEGKRLFESLVDPGLRLPAFLFDPVLVQEPGHAQLARFLQDAGPYKLLRVGAKFDPTAEICDNGTDDNANGQADCQDAACSKALACRPEIKNRLDLFVMSQCPFGIKALDAMREVLPAFGGEIDFHIHYIADELDGQPVSMHGDGEVDEDIRQLCAIKLYGKDHKYMDYIWCRNQDMNDAEWKKCAKNGIRANRIARCAESVEGRELLLANLETARSLDIGASPTWMVNNRIIFSGITPEQIKQNYCRTNPSGSGCDKTLSGDVNLPAGGCGSN